MEHPEAHQDVRGREGRRGAAVIEVVVRIGLPSEAQRVAERTSGAVGGSMALFVMSSGPKTSASMNSGYGRADTRSITQSRIPKPRFEY